MDENDYGLIETLTGAQALGHSDAASRYWDEKMPDIVEDTKSLKIERVYGWSSKDLLTAYVHYYTGTWNAMIDMDAAAESLGLSPIHGRFRDLAKLDFGILYLQACDSITTHDNSLEDNKE